MKVKTKHDVRRIIDPCTEWESVNLIFKLYKWSLYVLRNDAYAGYTDCSPSDVEIFLEHTTLDESAIMYIEREYQMPIKAKGSLSSVCNNPEAIFDRLKPYIEAVISERVDFNPPTRLGLYFYG